MFHAAKVLHQTAKTCQYLKENYKKMHFFLIYDENFHLLRSGDKKAAPEGAAGGGERCVRTNANAVHDWGHLLLSCETYKMPRAAKRDEVLRESHN